MILKKCQQKNKNNLKLKLKKFNKIVDKSLKKYYYKIS